MKALILAGGAGTRLKPLTDAIPKQLLPVANKPIMFYAIEQISQAQIDDIGIVVSQKNIRDIKAAIGDGSRWGRIHVTYILQDKPLGLAHAVKSAQGFLGKSSFLLFLGDNMIKDRLEEPVNDFERRRSDALIFLKQVDNPGSFGIAELDKMGRVIKVEEKPKQPRSNLAIIGVYLFSSKVHDIVDTLKPSWRGEYEITDAIQGFIDIGSVVNSYHIKSWWFDTGNKEDLLEANRAVLEDFTLCDMKGRVDSKSQIEGKVEIKQKTIVENSVIHGPVSIAEGCHIKDSFIGPFTSIGNNTVIEDSYIARSILLGRCRIHHTGHLIDSLVGNRVELSKVGESSDEIRLFLAGARAE